MNKPVKIIASLAAIILIGFLFVSQNHSARPVVILGDSQHDLSIYQKVIQRIIQEKPVAVFQLGDQVDDGQSHQQWESFNQILNPLRRISSYYPTLGNHEMNSTLYYDNFVLPNNEQWYSVIVEGIRFIVLNSNASLDKGSEQRLWLEATLEEFAKKSQYIILTFHHPLFTSSASHLEDEMSWRPILLPLIERYKIDAVFSGHSHNYERFFYNNTYYIVSGGAGSRLFGSSRITQNSQLFAKSYNYCRIDKEKNGLAVTVRGADGELIDSFKIKPKNRS